MFMAIILLILGLAVIYAIEVVRGSDVTQYDCEVGWPSHLEEPKTLTREEFFGYLLPMVLTGLGISLIFAAPWWGCLSLSAAVILYVGRRVW
jgi:hypothetical protein